MLMWSGLGGGAAQIQSIQQDVHKLTGGNAGGISRQHHPINGSGERGVFGYGEDALFHS